MFLPTTKKELQKLGWDRCDVILVTGDAYIDSPYIGVAVIGHVLMNAGYKVGIIAQPASGDVDIKRLGEPTLFWGVTGGCVDSMVGNFTAVKKPRRSDDFTPGNRNNKRPNRAVIYYSNLIRQNFKNTVPIVLGGLEASLRRTTHYDYWDNALRKPILFDAKADYLIYGMGEKAVLQFAEKRKNGKTKEELKDIEGLCYVSDKKSENYQELPSFDEVKKDKNRFVEMFREFYNNNLTADAKRLVQKIDNRYMIQNPPQPDATAEELDSYAELPFERDAHPYYSAMGEIKALETIRFSITTHRGCFGQCNFCAISAHQGKRVISRSERSIIEEAKRITALPGFKGFITDLGGPTANMYGMTCGKKDKWTCHDKKCLFPEVCSSLVNSHKRQLDLLKKIRELKGVKKVFIASGVRYDLVITDERYGDQYLEELVDNHISGQMKLAPEHMDEKVLKLMGKPSLKNLKAFRDKFFKMNKEKGKKQFLTYYLIAAHPGCSEKEMMNLRGYLRNELKATSEQVQIFTPTPSTWSSLMYYTETDPLSGEKIFVEKEQTGKEDQKNILA